MRGADGAVIVTFSSNRAVNKPFPSPPLLIVYSLPSTAPAPGQLCASLRCQHQEVVGLKVTVLDDKMPAGAIHDCLVGFGKGATEAPGASYRLESAISDMFHTR